MLYHMSIHCYIFSNLPPSNPPPSSRHQLRRNVRLRGPRRRYSTIPSRPQPARGVAELAGSARDGRARAVPRRRRRRRQVGRR